MPKENGDTGRGKMQHFQKVGSGSSSTIHALRSMEDENLDYDSNASSSSFEFDKGERAGNNAANRSLFRPIPSKWNDAEKWIMNRQNIQANHSKKHVSHNQANRMATSMVRVAPESAHYDHKLPAGKVTETKRVDFCQPTSHMGFEKFSFVPSDSHSVSGQAHGGNPVVESFPQSKDLKEVNELGLSCSRSTDDQSGMLFNPKSYDICSSVSTRHLNTCNFQTDLYIYNLNIFFLYIGFFSYMRNKFISF